MSNRLIDDEILMKEFNFEKNVNIDLSSLTLGSEKKIWWKCKKGHEWESNIYNRSHGKNGCPICANRIVLQGFNDLSTKYPNIAKQWNYKKNKSLKPTQVTYGSSKKVWWKCDKGHEWLASINNRTMGKNCPLCAKDTQTSFPEQAIYFYSKSFFKNVINRYKDKYEIDVFIKDINVGIEYDGRYYHNNINAKNIEHVKEEYFSSKGIKIYRIKEISDFPIIENNNYLYYNYDNGKNLSNVLKKLFRKLGVSNIDIDIARDYIKIQQLYISSEKENSILSVKPELCKEWDYEKNNNIKPDMISYSSAKKVWWKCPKCNNDYLASVYSRYKGTNCPYCTNRILIKGVNDLETTNPKLAKEWNYAKNKNLTPKDVIAGGKSKVWWKCSKCGYEWQAFLYARNNGVGCPVCANKIIIAGKNDVQTTNLELIKEWDYEKNEVLPTEVGIGSGKSIWWRCSKNHSYKKRLIDRKKGSGCPYCCNQKVLKGFNDLETTNPKLAKEWNYEKNGNLTPNDVTKGSKVKVWWKCLKCNYEWQAQIVNRNNGTGCPNCKNLKDNIQN